ncbi:phenoloxidase-activating factor 2-like [Anopheles cruzii]|uniref:phenoloxidase-activating factor 2-like n=1 Tax=Anopheles cruzii TaxID=68878 RepID=UPI0022EC8D04|nr:phenoloxidase-activating factor 2-like [Anopheles cruzii]XP_052861927.1 phenoloxidase-activating factor 2-like [Anopheles cruzii]
MVTGRQKRQQRLGIFCGVFMLCTFAVAAKEYQNCTTSDSKPGICVYQYQCINGVLGVSGENIIDVRFFDDCNDYLMKCCIEPVDDDEPETATDPPPSADTVAESTTVGPAGPTQEPPPSTGGSDRGKGNRPGVIVPPYAPQECGQRNPRGVMFRIQNEEFSETEYGEYPWVVAIFRRVNGSSLKYLCGGALLDGAAVLTTSTCLYKYRNNPSQLVVRLGEWDMSTTREPIPHVDSDVQTLHVHPQYGLTSKINDIAIVILTDTVEFNHTVGVVCLPPQSSEHWPNFKDVIGVGWGEVPKFVQKQPQTILKKAHLTSVDHESCQRKLRKLVGPKYTLHRSFLCAEGTPPEMLPCNGDNGSPYMAEIERGSERYYLVGLISWGFDCNHSNAPAVMTNVAYNREWIDEVIRSEHLSPWSYTYQRTEEFGE